MREFITIVEGALHEKFARGNVVASFNVRGKICEVYKNPAPGDLRAIIKDAGHNAPRCFLVGDDAFVWNTFTALHQEVREHMGIGPDAIPLMLFGEPRRGLDAMVTDNSQGTPWWHNGLVDSEIRYHPYLEAIFGEDRITVSYYDEAIYGPWDELGSEDDDQDD